MACAALLFQHVLQGSQRLKKTYRIESLPPYIIFHVKRFTRNNFFTEKNPTIVNFPVKNLELREYLNLDEALLTEDELTSKYGPREPEFVDSILCAR